MFYTIEFLAIEKIARHLKYTLIISKSQHT